MNPEEALQKARDAPGTDGKVVRVHESETEELYVDHAWMHHIMNRDEWAVIRNDWHSASTVDGDRVSEKVVGDPYDVVESVEVIDWEDSLFAQEGGGDEP